jgi:adenosine deaminase
MLICRISQIAAAATIQEIKKINKVELHLHLGGAWPIDFLQSIAQPDIFAQLCHCLDLIEQGIDYKQSFQVFNIIGNIVNTDDRVENGVVALCDNLAADGVTYVEMRTGLKDVGSGLEGYLNAVLRGLERGCDKTGLKAAVLLSLRRDTSAQIACQTVHLVQKYRNKNVIGLDLSGISVQGNGDGIIEAINLAKKNNIPIALHIGESPEETAEQQMKELRLIQPARIGHGVFLCPEALGWIKEHKIPIELCLTSAIKVMLSGDQNHPALKLLSSNHPVAICTDDPLIFRTSLSRECALVAHINNLTLEDIITLQDNAQRYCFKMSS